MSSSEQKEPETIGEAARRLLAELDARLKKRPAMENIAQIEFPSGSSISAGKAGTALGVTGEPSRFDKKAPEAGYAGGLTFELPRQGGK